MQAQNGFETTQHKAATGGRGNPHPALSRWEREFN
jgi:hypothetical protein